MEREVAAARPGGLGPEADKGLKGGAIGLLSSVVIGVSSTFLMHAKAYRDQRFIMEMQQNVRFAMDAVCRDVRMAGYGLSIRSSELTNWITWVPGMTVNPLVRPGCG